MKPMSPQEVAQVCGGLDNIVSFLPPENAQSSPFGPYDPNGAYVDPTPDPYPEYP